MSFFIGDTTAAPPDITGEDVRRDHRYFALAGAWAPLSAAEDVCGVEVNMVLSADMEIPVWEEPLGCNQPTVRFLPPASGNGERWADIDLDSPIAADTCFSLFTHVEGINSGKILRSHLSDTSTAATESDDTASGHVLAAVKSQGDELPLQFVTEDPYTDIEAIVKASYDQELATAREDYLRALTATAPAPLHARSPAAQELFDKLSFQIAVGVLQNRGLQRKLELERKQQYL
jgi:hypothetical protein